MKGDVAVSFSIPPDVDKSLDKMALDRGVTRREIIIQALSLLAKRAGK